MQRLGLLETLILVALAGTGCPGDDGSGDEGAGSTSSSTAATGTEGATTVDATSVASGTMGGSGSTSMPGDDTTTGGLGPVMCAEQMCVPGQVCVHPCGGGAQPPCEPQEPDGTCPPGTMPDQDGLCQDPCEGGACCAPEPEDLTPFCLGVDELTCEGTICDAPNCVAGELQDGQLQCGCPP